MADVPNTSGPGLIEWAGGARATLAITFTDIKDSARLADELGDEQMREVQEGHFAQSTSLIADNGGRRIKGLGDGDMAAFQNVEAALDYVLALQTNTGHLLLDARVRAGIHIGPVTVTADDVYGNAVNFASRVGSATKAAEIWLSDEALRHLVALRAARHGELRWQDHPGAQVAGLGAYTLWSVSASGRTLTELAAEFRRGRIVPPKAAETNIPAGMVPRVFRGRDDDLAAIEAALKGGDKPVLVTAPSVTALHGLRGVGKSVLAARYAELHDARYRATWWIRSETEAGLRADLAGLAVRLGWAKADATEEDAIATARERLRKEGGGILLVFDNARDAASLRPYLPRGGGAHVIVTANAPNWGRVATPVAIEVWPKETGGGFLVERAPRRGDLAAAEALSAALGGLPLAHEMAASYCERTGLSFAGYRERLMAEAPKLLDSGDDAPDEYHDRQTVAKAFALAIEEAARDNPAAEMLIGLMALLPPEPIPRFLFSEGMGELFAGGVDAAVAALRDFALIDCEAVPDERDPSQTTDTLRLHRLVREVATARLDDAAREAAQQVVIKAMAAVYPFNIENPRNWLRARRLDAAAFALVGRDGPVPSEAEAAAAQLMNQVASYRMNVLAAYPSAELLFRRTLAINETRRGLDHPIVAICLNNLAGLLRETGRLGEAEPLYRRGLTIAEKVHGGADHPDVAVKLNNLAGLLRQTGQLEEAEPLYCRALAIFEARLGPDHHNVATGLNNLAELLRDTGRSGEAEPLYRRALAIVEMGLDPDHPDVAMCLNNLAGLLRDTGRAGEAELFYRRALAILEASLGPEHPNTVAVRENLAALLAGR